ncbi:50S ribosomal protein L24 [Actinoallomurus iriomotensis]|jgi:large subunit ribosomal protein L24|uniref:Large ribosomal subunit protein uL24 n=1 Tax=Actinoallomurus iriomotensis TaxID=478107 RepID=A0A9W6RKH8_9ACTN|nr:50S ribosomal protein L24 [Actinoallomurus iriomotensis]GLY76620.1 50S ribosomal protein L24 [Actinoallomurus iriomotensis]GLY91227.1 50S ribosomal protein L24 [Actinoallomurus iriomotensis]
MKIKKGDDVIVIAGKDKGATGKVIAADPNRERVTVEGVNLVKRHTKETNQGPRGAKDGGVVTKEASIHVSNVALVEDGKPTRVGYRFDDDGTKVRISRRTGKDI